MAKSIRIEQVEIGAGSPPFIVAELSGNHNGSLDRALELVDKAADAGVSAIKIQTFTPDTITLPIKSGRFYIDDPKSLWHGKSLYELYQVGQTPYEWHKAIFERCRKKGLIGFSTPFDVTAVDFLESLNVPCYKIGALEISDHELIKKCAATKKPLIISAGAVTLSEIDETVRIARENGCTDLILLHCLKAYPADPAEFHLKKIPHLAALFDCIVGISDHSPGIGVAIASISHGACLIEKHLTLSRKEKVIDSDFSLEPTEMKQLVEESKRAFVAQGSATFGITPSEELERTFRRSLYFAEKLAPETVITRAHIRSVRPGGGLEPKYIDAVIGQKVQKGVEYGDPVTWEVFQCRK